jgi:hypothetical protein
MDESMNNYQISFLENNDLEEAAKVLSVAMLHNPLHVAVFQGHGEKERQEIEQMFIGLFTKLPGIIFLAKEVSSQKLGEAHDEPHPIG